jgi:hypothetical protein
MHVGDAARQDSVRELAPALDAAHLEPRVERGQVRKGRHGLPKLPPGVLHVLLDLAFLPSRGRGAERRLEQVVTGQGRKARVDLPRLARPDAVDGSPHVVENAAARNPAQHAERLGQGVEQHLVGLQLVGPDHKGPAVRQLGVRGLQLDPLAADHRPVLAPVELECLAGLESQRHEHAAPGCALRDLPLRPPLPDKGRNPSVGAVIAQGDQVRVELPCGPAPFAPLPRRHHQPPRQLVGKRVQPARAPGHLEPHLHRVRPQILADRIPRQPGPPLDLPDRCLIPVTPPADHAQQLHVDHSDNPDRLIEERGQTGVHPWRWTGRAI